MGARSRAGKGSKASAKGKTEKKPEVKQQDVAPKTLWQKAFDREAELEPQEALKITHWIRQAMGIIIGTVLGFLQITGAPGILTFFLLSFVGPPAFLTNFHDIDIEEVNKVGTVQTEGLMPGGALFILSWIISYTVFLPAST